MKKLILIGLIGMMLLSGCSSVVSDEAAPVPVAGDRELFIDQMEHQISETDSFKQNKKDYVKVSSNATAHPGIFDEMNQAYSDQLQQIKISSEKVREKFKERINNVAENSDGEEED